MPRSAFSKESAKVLKKMIFGLKTEGKIENKIKTKYYDFSQKNMEQGKTNYFK
jgi:hypothetical protein